MKNAFLRIAAAILKKDVLSLYPLLLLTVLLQAVDILVAKLDVWPVLSSWLRTMLIGANSFVILSVVQTDPPVSLTDDWLCRPVPRSALILAKLSLLTLVLYLPRVLTILLADLLYGYTLVESALEALLIQGWIEMLYVPIVLMVAVCTANLLQGIGAMISLFVLVFVIPTLFVSPPGPENLAVGESLQGNGLRWMSVIPGKLIFVLASVLCLWTAYAHRNLRSARLMLAGGVVIGVLAVVAPMILVPWQSTFALQRSLHAEPAPTSPAHRASLRHALACFPAMRMSEVSTNSDFNDASRHFGVHRWSDDQLKAAGSDAIAFITRVSARGLPDDWRVQVAHVQAKYYGSGPEPLLRLRPSRYAAGSTNGFGGETIETITHTWLLPQAALKALEKIEEPTLDLEYSAAVLKPVSVMLAADGKRHHVPDIGTCGATRDTLNNHIVVDCFIAGRQPAMLSAELDGVPASRVDSGAIDFAPTPLRVFNSRHVELAIQSATLVESNFVKINAYYPSTFNTLRVRSQGVLGDSLAACPLPSVTSVNAPQVSSWNDRSPHERKSIAVEDGVHLEVLDWGGSGRPFVLLHGLGATAHSFDELAPLLSEHFRVVGITRRGIGYSSRPDHGYSQARLTRDIVQVLDALAIERAVFVGHSIAGDELSTLGVHHAKRVAALIYLDAAYDRSSTPSSRYRELNSALPDSPRPTPDELLSYASLQRYFDRVGSVPLPEGELIAMWNAGNRYLAGQRAVDPRILQAISAEIPSPDYAALDVPALAIYAMSAGPDALLKPWHDANDIALRETLRQLQTLRDAMQRREIERFRTGVKGARVLELPGASHWVLLSHRDAVLQAIVDFAATLPAD